jgi:hypothetical protein
MSESLRMLNVPVSKQTEKDLPSLMPKPKDFPLEYPRKGLILAKSYVSMGGR